jgi:hypothetical protein
MSEFLFEDAVAAAAKKVWIIGGHRGWIVR